MSRGLVRFWAIFALAAVSAGAQTVDDVITKSIEAQGGLARLESVKTLRTSGKLSIQSFDVRFVEVAKRSDKVREEMTVQGMSQVRAYDGKTAWQVNPFEGRRDPEMLSADDSKDLQIDADIDGPLVNYKEKGYGADLVGHDSVEGTDCYKIKLTLKNGDIRYYYLDTDTFMELKLETQTSIRGSIQENETYYGDYEEVNGIYYPFAFETGQKGSVDRVKFTVEKVEQNVPLDDSLFSMPAVKKPAATGAD
ncbi:MAG TPA: outer membrane lipoprotein-sorting protein [Candidatus Acidoferrales bacterium]|nr:outer membrane lipoprotein-sorting protein [Candidatus Acidoferrales bacterium]